MLWGLGSQLTNAVGPGVTTNTRETVTPLLVAEIVVLPALKVYINGDIGMATLESLDVQVVTDPASTPSTYAEPRAPAATGLVITNVMFTGGGGTITLICA